MKGTAKNEAAKLFEEYVLKTPAVNKDAGNKKKDTRPGGPDGNGPDTLTVDLHGMKLEEALRKADQALGRAGRNGVQRVKIITGTGKHSPGLYSPLYAGMEDHLSSKAGFAFTKKDGVFTVWLK